MRNCLFRFKWPRFFVWCLFSVFIGSLSAIRYLHQRSIKCTHINEIWTHEILCKCSIVIWWVSHILRNEILINVEIIFFIMAWHGNVAVIWNGMTILTQPQSTCWTLHSYIGRLVGKWHILCLKQRNAMDDKLAKHWHVREPMLNKQLSFQTKAEHN